MEKQCCLCKQEDRKMWGVIHWESGDKPICEDCNNILEG